MKKQYKLYNVFPMYLAVIFSKLILIPIVGNLVIDSVITLVITLMFFKRFHVSFFFKTLGVSYLTGMAGAIMSVLSALILLELIPLYSFFVEEQINSVRNLFLFISFLIGTVWIFCVNFFVNFGVMNRLKPWKKALKLWQRLIPSLTFTLLNAPYALLLVRNEWLREQGYQWFYNIF